MSTPPSSHLRHKLPEYHRRWIRAGLRIAAVAYACAILTRALQGTPVLHQEVALLLLCLASIFAEPKNPRLATTAVLIGVWTEIMLSFSLDPAGLRSPSSVALPLLVLSAALLDSAVAAWLVALGSSVAMPVCLLIGFLYFGGPGIPDADIGFLVILEISILGSATLLTIFLKTLASHVKRETETAARFLEFIEKAPDAVVAVTHDGTVAAFNSLAAEYLKLDRKQVLGKPFENIRVLYPDCFPQRVSLLSARPDQLQVHGRNLEVRLRKLHVGDAQNDWIFVLRDVSDREAAARDTAALRSQLNHIQKMDAIGQLAGGVAHDFNNLLTAVSGAAYALKDADPQETAEISHELLEATEQGAALTRQLLTFARKEVVQAKVIHLDQALDASRALISRLLGERITLNIVSQPFCTVRLDEGQLKQVLLNFAANARDAIDGRGTFTLRCSPTNDHVILEVSDTGHGMSQQVVDHIFEPFFTTKPSNQGTGLGLATVHGIVNQWSGQIHVESHLGRGTTFTISWPLVDDEPTGVVYSPHAKPNGPISGQVLLVEDNEVARRFIRRILDRAGYKVVEAVSGEDALRRCTESEPDLLLTDVMMPGMTGVDLARNLHDRWPTLPVLFVSGYVDDVLSDWPYDTARDLLLKPFTAEALLARIERKLLTASKRSTEMSQSAAPKA